MSQAMYPTPDSTFDGYRCIRLLDRGGFGEVWLCKKEVTQTYCALKWISRQSGSGFEKELHALHVYDQKIREIRSPHLIPIEHINANHHALFYIMPLADGCNPELSPELSPEHPEWRPYTLESLIRYHSQQPQWPAAEEVLTWIDPILQALESLSSNGFVHRDVKPTNVLICNGSPVLADFSLLSHDHSLISRQGSPFYVTPDWYRGGHPDMYSAALLIYHAFTGQSPECVGKSNYRFPIQGQNSLTPHQQTQWLAVRRVILRAMMEEVNERYLDFPTLRAALDQAVTNPEPLTSSRISPKSPAPNHEPNLPTPFPASSSQSSHKNSTLIAFAVTIALITVGVALWNFSRKSPKTNLPQNLPTPQIQPQPQTHPTAQIPTPLTSVIPLSDMPDRYQFTYKPAPFPELNAFTTTQALEKNTQLQAKQASILSFLQSLPQKRQIGTPKHGKALFNSYANIASSNQNFTTEQAAIQKITNRWNSQFPSQLPPLSKISTEIPQFPLPARPKLTITPAANGLPCKINSPEHYTQKELIHNFFESINHLLNPLDPTFYQHYDELSKAIQTNTPNEKLLDITERWIIDCPYVPSLRFIRIFLLRQLNQTHLAQKELNAFDFPRWAAHYGKFHQPLLSNESIHTLSDFLLLYSVAPESLPYLAELFLCFDLEQAHTYQTLRAPLTDLAIHSQLLTRPTLTPKSIEETLNKQLDQQISLADLSEANQFSLDHITRNLLDLAQLAATNDQPQLAATLFEHAKWLILTFPSDPDTCFDSFNSTLRQTQNQSSTFSTFCASHPIPPIPTRE